VDLTCPDHLAGLECGDHSPQPIWHDVADNAREAYRTHRQPRQVKPVVSAIVRQISIGDDLRTDDEVPLGVLHRDNPWMLR
jgi:hypothetical protein